MVELIKIQTGPEEDKHKMAAMITEIKKSIPKLAKPEKLHLARTIYEYFSHHLQHQAEQEKDSTSLYEAVLDLAKKYNEGKHTKRTVAYIDLIHTLDGHYTSEQTNPNEKKAGMIGAIERSIDNNFEDSQEVRKLTAIVNGPKPSNTPFCDFAEQYVAHFPSKTTGYPGLMPGIGPWGIGPTKFM